MQSRLHLLAVIFVISSIALLGRLFYWQGPMAATLAAKAQYQYNSGTEIEAHRGNILAHDGTWLAASTQAWLLYASPKVMLTDSRVIANTLAPFLVEPKDDVPKLQEETNRILGLLSKRDAVWVPIKHRLTNNTKESIESLKLEGLGFEEEEARSYPEASVAAQLLGFVGRDDAGADKGYFGLEGHYDLSLSGKDGYMERESDALGAPIFFGESKEIAAAPGIDLVTHIDKKIQITVEQKLKEGIEAYGAKSGSAVVMDPRTGGILAMSSFPSYDPRTYYDYSNEVFKNPIISDSFEPGSIFKPIVMASGLDAGVVTPDTICDICSGPAKVDKYSIETWDNKYYPNSTMLDVIKHSDNVGMVFVGNRLGKDKLINYLEKFGIGQTTNIDLQGEANPKMREKSAWNIVDQATATFGQGIAVTPIQMVRAISIIANGGIFVNPQVVDKFKGDTWEEDIKPSLGERVISEKAAKQMTDIMVAAVSQGEAKWAVPKGFKVAGKTGTAQIPVQGHYDAEKTNASFVGFAPVDNPRFVMLITLREPQTSPWASETSAPLWFKIAKELFPYLGIQPEN
jgi:stage V sporulation protein D (sporulation-specific penicillin-binding protein)